MGRPLVLWFVYLLIVGSFVGLLAAHTLAAGTFYPRVFKVTGPSLVHGYALALLQNSIWQTPLEGDAQGVLRRAHLRGADRRHVRLAVAALGDAALAGAGGGVDWITGRSYYDWSGPHE